MYILFHVNDAVVLGVQECYVCVGGEVEGSREVEHQFPKEHLPMCQRGHTPPAKQCPPRYKGCLTQYNDDRVTRMCGELGLTVCQEANNIKYCYCQGQLCNKEDRPVLLEPTDGAGVTSDDEDIPEGSGYSTLNSHSTEIHSKSLHPITTLAPNKQSNHAFNINQSKFTLITTIITLLYLNAIV
ncbi:hypothetical protein O3M35_011840 [Rhynocoris fuscipes]|uniref:Uncharacterized protein n=1 Tax=Rhynocoris fuscipes TaxID=488301 RepID=A0AAW1CY41_9HEMI